MKIQNAILPCLIIRKEKKIQLEEEVVDGDEVVVELVVALVVAEKRRTSLKFTHS